jgi:DNA primase large subunit
MDDLCEQIAHPMAYYEQKLDDSDEDQVVDWRERQESKS